MDIEEIIEKYLQKKDSLISLLQDIQRLFGYLPQEELSLAAQKLDISLSKLYGVATFYNQFSFTPQGKNVIHLCTGTACHIKGADLLYSAINKALGVEEGQTTQDKKFTFKCARCLGTCFLAPVMMVNKDYFGELTPEKIEGILKEYVPENT